jgi:hypothetical protein
MARVGLVTALLPPDVGGTQVLVWRLFQRHPGLVIVSGAADSTPSSQEGYSALVAPTLHLPYPRLRGYRYGLAPVLGALSGAWLATALIRVTRFLKAQQVDHVVSIPHQGPFALLGILAARRLGIAHTLYILDAWEEGSTGPVERALIRWGLREAARMPRSRLAVVSPALGAHYRKAFGFRDITWIPNPGPLPAELPATRPEPRPFVLFTGGVKRFNVATLGRVVRSIRQCKVVEKLILTGHTSAFVDPSDPQAGPDDRTESRLCSPAEISLLQRQAAVLLVATNVDDVSQTSLGYLPGRLPEYVSTRRPILLIGPQGSDAARAVRHWRLGQTTSSQDETELARLLDTLATQAMNESGGGGVTTHHDQFLELFSREEARRRLFGEPSPVPLSSAAAALGAEFELPLMRS